MTCTVRTRDDSATEQLGRDLVSKLGPGTVIALSGPLGSGKTVFVRGVARGLGIDEPVTSPSFTIVSEYSAPIPLVHVDLYRTGSDEELELLGLDDILDRAAIIAIEWAEKAESFLADGAPTIVRVALRIDGDEREITIAGAEIDGPCH